MHICWSKVTDGASSLGLDEGWCGNAGVTWERIVQPDFWPNLLDQVRIRKSCGRPVCRRLGWRSPWNQKLLLRFRLGHDMHVCNLLSPSMPRHSGKCTFIENCLQAADIDDELEKEMEKELESFLEEEKRLEEEVGKVSEQEARARAAAAMKALEVEPTQKCGHDDAPTEAYSQGIPEEACDVQHPAKRQRMDAAGEDEVLSASQEADMDELLKLQEEQLQLERQIEEKRAKKEEQKRLAQAAAEAAEKARQEALLKEQQQEEERRQEEKRRKRELVQKQLAEARSRTHALKRKLEGHGSVPEPPGEESLPAAPALLRSRAHISEAPENAGPPPAAQPCPPVPKQPATQAPPPTSTMSSAPPTPKAPATVHPAATASQQAQADKSTAGSAAAASAGEQKVATLHVLHFMR